MNRPQTIKTRFAPSPTGSLHVGGLRTALYNYLFAKHHGGQFLLRIEDTDQSRKVAGAEKEIRDMLKKFGLQWDNKPVVQSRRLKMYRQAAKRLVESNHAYYCFCTPEELEAERKRQQDNHQPMLHRCGCPELTSEEVAIKINHKTPHVIRLTVPRANRPITFTDVVRGQVSFEAKTIDDQVLLKSDGFPTYHLANVVDDHDMGITHVIRGEEWLPSTPKHVLLYQAFGWPIPIFAHLPLLLNPDKSKLSKRQGDVAVKDYVHKGYLPEALLNFVLLLGWNPGTDKELFNMQEMIQNFSLEKVNKAGAVFDTQKLDWLNGNYIRQLAPAKLSKLARPYFKAAKIKTLGQPLEKIIATEQARIKKLDDIVDATGFFFELPAYEKTLLPWKGTTANQAADALKVAVEIIHSPKTKPWTTSNLEATFKTEIANRQLTVGQLLWPLRVALSGRAASPGPFEIAAVLGKKETLRRVDQAIKKLEK